MTRFKISVRITVVLIAITFLIPTLLVPKVDLKSREKSQKRALQTIEKCELLDDCTDMVRGLIGDRIFGVEQSARLLANMRYYIFGDSPTQRVGLTNRRELILTGWSDKVPYGQARVCDPNNYKKSNTSFKTHHKSLVEWAKKTNVNYYTFIVPSIITILGDRPSSLPSFVRENCQKFQDIQPYEDFNQEHNFFYPFTHYYSKRDDFEYYPNINFHWGARSAIDVVSIWAKNNGIKTLYPLGKETFTKLKSDISSTINLDLEYTDVEYAYMKTKAEAVNIGTGSVKMLTYNQDVAGVSSHALVIGNSFTEQGHKHFLPYFNRVTKVNMNRVQDDVLDLWFESFVETENVTHIIVLAHSVNGDHFLSRLNKAIQ